MRKRMRKRRRRRVGGWKKQEAICVVTTEGTAGLELTDRHQTHCPN